MYFEELDTELTKEMIDYCLSLLFVKGLIFFRSMNSEVKDKYFECC